MVILDGFGESVSTDNDSNVKMTDFTGNIGFLIRFEW